MKRLRRLWVILAGLVLVVSAFTVSGQEPTFVVRATQQFDCSLTPRDVKGNEAPIDGVPVWIPSDPAFLQITAAPDGMTARVVVVGPVGSAKVNVSADADMGEGVREITGCLDVNIIAGDAVTLELVPAPPIEVLPTP